MTGHSLSKEVNLSFPNQFHCAVVYSRLNQIRGGSSIFVYKKFVSRKGNINKCIKEFNFKVFAAFLGSANIIVVSNNHSQNGNPYKFFNTLDYLVILHSGIAAIL